MNRSTNIKSRVLRTLNLYGLKNSTVQDEEIYDQITQGQDHIISEVLPSKIITIALEADIDEYLLTTEITRKNISSIKIIKLPSTWINDFKITTEKEFVEYVNEAISDEGQPVIGCVVNGYLKVFPTPTNDYDGDELECYVYESFSAGIIDVDTEPDLPEIFDKALELFAVPQFLIEPQSSAAFFKFEKELSRLRPLLNRKHHTFSRPKPTGW